ncbi:MAG: HU family DNA-binding protein [Firmicutes bacterium]|nr:HU family DNA-binding protein [Bacillota bacterium]
MKKAEIVEQIAEKFQMTKKETNAIIDEFSMILTNALKRGDEVALDIGKFHVKKRAERTGVNPATGEKIKVPAKVVPNFKPSKKFRESIVA